MPFEVVRGSMLIRANSLLRYARFHSRRLLLETDHSNVLQWSLCDSMVRSRNSRLFDQPRHSSRHSPSWFHLGFWRSFTSLLHCWSPHRSPRRQGTYRSRRSRANPPFSRGTRSLQHHSRLPSSEGRSRCSQRNCRFRFVRFDRSP